MKKSWENAAVIQLVFIFSLLPVQSLAQTAQPAAQGTLLTLEELIAEAETNNPELRAATYELRAARQRVQPAGALPDPMVTVGQMNAGNIVPLTSLGKNEMTRASIGISQELPFFGKRALREKVAVKEADAEYWNYESTRLRILAELKAAYYDLFLQSRILETLRKNMRLLETFEETASALYRVGNGNQADVLRAQTELSRLQEHIELAEQRKTVAEAQINALLNRPPDTPLSPPAPYEKATLRHSLEELRELALNQFPLLRQQGEVIQARQFALQLAEKERYPDFGVMFSYHNRGGLPSLWEIEGTARIPLYFNRKQKYEIEEAGARLSAAWEQRESLRASIQFSLKDHYLEATTTERLLQLLEQTIVPQETLTLEAASASYQVGGIDFLSVIDSLLKIVNDEVRYYEYLTNFQKALTRLEPIVGVELTR
ncbi:MAG: TolC family protein [Acidobacteria bacterium]|nr:TolC family protein [Acidobacteriota bacterium]